MVCDWPEFALGNVADIADYVANGSFASLKENVSYSDTPDYAVLVRLVDHNSAWKGNKVYVTEHAYKFLRKSSLTSGDIVVANVGANAGSTFRVPQLDRPATLGPNAVRVRPITVNTGSNRLSLDYLYYWLVSPEGQAKLASITSGSAQPKFNKTDMRSLPIRLPPFVEQERAASLLQSLDARIDLLRQTNATLESIAQALFKSWFIDFDPVRAKAEGREPLGLDAATAALFPDEFEESALGVIPKGWGLGTFGNIASLAKGAVNPLDNPTRMFEHYSLPAFDAGQLPVFEEGTGIKSNKTRVPEGAVLQSKLNPHIPRVWFVHDVGEHAVCSTEFLPWVARLGASPELVYCTLCSPSFGAQVRTLVTGTSNSHQRVKPDQVASLGIVVAPPPVVAAFTSFVEPMLEKVGANRLQARRLAELRNTLLPRLISGKLRLPEAQERLADALA